MWTGRRAGSRFGLAALVAMSLFACRSAEIDIGEEGGTVAHPLLTACETATFDLVVEQTGKAPVKASGRVVGGLIVFDAPAILGFETAKPVTVQLTVTAIPPRGPVAECPFSPREKREGRFIPLKWLGHNHFGIDLEDLRVEPD